LAEWIAPATRSDRREPMKTIAQFLNKESRATAIEYGLIAAGFAVPVLSVVIGLGSKLDGAFTFVLNTLK
jgi:pilus assembly protein Flp/PilA